MKKLYSLFAAVVLAATVNAQTTATYTFSGANQSEVLSGTIDSNLTFVTAKGASAQSPTFYTAAPAGVRIYSDRATGDGNSFTISVATGYEITGLSFTAVASYNPTVTYSVDGGAFATMPKSTNDYTLSGIAAASTLTFKNAHLGGTSNIQLRIPSFTVTYRPTSSMAVGNVNAAKVNLVKNTVVDNNILFSAKADVKVISMNGQVVKSASVNENTSLNVADLAKGTYIVTGTVNGKAVSEKIIKK